MTTEILRTQRLALRQLTQDDLPALCETLQDAQAMAAWGHAFSLDEARAWLDKQLRRYRETGMGLWAVCRREDGQLIGQCGVTWQDVGAASPVAEVGYLFARAYWHRGYAAEAARACRDWAFEHLWVDEVYSLIRPMNRASRHVAIRNGMRCEGQFLKEYRGQALVHDLYAITRREWLRVTGRPGASEAWDLMDAERRPIARTVLRRGRLPAGCYHLGVRVIVADGEGNVLLVHSAKRRSPRACAWECPGGAVLSGESSVRAAQRELCEETGIALDEEDFHFLTATTSGSCHHDSYLAVKKTPLRALTFQPGETDRAEWVPYREFEAMPAGRMPAPKIRRMVRQSPALAQLAGLRGAARRGEKSTCKPAQDDV